VLFIRVLGNARRLFAEYLNEDWSPSPQPAGNSQVTADSISFYCIFSWRAIVFVGVGHSFSPIGDF
jgi:hypothetical protein